MLTNAPVNNKVAPLDILIDSIERRLFEIAVILETTQDTQLTSLLDWVLKKIDPTYFTAIARAQPQTESKSSPLATTSEITKQLTPEQALNKLNSSHSLRCLKDNWDVIAIFLNVSNTQAVARINRITVSYQLLKMNFFTSPFIALCLQIPFKHIDVVRKALAFLSNTASEIGEPFIVSSSAVQIILENPSQAMHIARAIKWLHNHDILTSENLALLPHMQPSRLRYLGHFSLETKTAHTLSLAYFDLFDTELRGEDKAQLFHGIFQGLAKAVDHARARETQESIYITIKTTHIKDILSLSERLENFYEEKTSSSRQALEKFAKEENESVSLSPAELFELTNLGFRLRTLAIPQENKSKALLLIKRDEQASSLQNLLGHERVHFLKEMKRTGRFYPEIVMLSFWLAPQSLHHLKTFSGYMEDGRAYFGNQLFNFTPIPLSYLKTLVPFIEEGDHRSLHLIIKAMNWMSMLDMLSVEKLKDILANPEGMQRLTCVKLNSDGFSDEEEMALRHLGECIYAGLLPLIKTAPSLTANSQPVVAHHHATLWQPTTEPRVQVVREDNEHKLSN